MRIEKIKTAKPFSSLFPINPVVLESIAESMMVSGFDRAKPLIIWEESELLIDGHTRLQAAKKAGVMDVPVVAHSFKNEDEAFDYAVRQQRDRRNLTDADIMRLVMVCDERRKKGGDRKSDEAKSKPTSVGNDSGRNETSAHATADRIGTNRGKVEAARKVIEKAPEPIKQAVLDGKMTINAAAKEAKAAESAGQAKQSPAKKSVFNQFSDSIEWAKWSWNPVTGCKFGCEYCYAHDIGFRFNGDFEPMFHPDRLDAPKNTALPVSADIGQRNVFVCSMADLFGPWVPQEWIDSVLEVVRAAKDWTFLFLTKNPARMVGIDWPENAWVGTTVDKQSRVDAAQEAFTKIKAPVKFLSCEPLLGPVSFTDISVFDWVIVGARSKTTTGPEYQPEWAWVESLLSQARDGGCEVYFKPNLKCRPSEYPKVR